MASTIDVARIVQFGDNYRHRVQEAGSVFRGIFEEVDVVGKRKKIDFLASTSSASKTGRNQGITYVDPTHTARWLATATEYWSALVDKEDIMRVLADPRSKYLENGVMAMNRHYDAKIIAAFDATVTTQEDADGTTPFDSNYQIAAGGTGMTISKLRQALQKLEEGGYVYQDDHQLYCVIAPAQKANLLATTEATSSDYSNVKALVHGETDMLLGFKFLTCNQLATGDGLGVGASTDRECYCFSNKSMMVGMGKDLMTKVTEQTQLVSHPWQLYIEHDLGAVRLQEELIVQIDCDETV